MSEKRDAYVAKMKSKLDKWNGEIGKLETKINQAGAETREGLHVQIVGLQAKRAEVSTKLESLRHAGDDAWRDLRGGVETSWKSLEKAVHTATGNFKQSKPVKTT